MSKAVTEQDIMMDYMREEINDLYKKLNQTEIKLAECRKAYIRAKNFGTLAHEHRMYLMAFSFVLAIVSTVAIFA